MKRVIPALLIGGCCLLAAAATYRALQAQRTEPPASIGTGPAQSIEIDIPGDQQALVKRGGALRFVVGYFADQSAADPAFSYTVSGRDAAVVRPGVVRLPLHKWSGTAASMIVRVRTVTSGGQSSWSPPSIVLTAQDVAALDPIPAPSAEAPAGAGKAGSADEAEGKKRKEKDPKEPKPADAEPGPRASARIEKAERQFAQNPGLKEALEKQFPKVHVAETFDGYQNLTNYVAALYASQSLNIPFQELKPYTTGRKSGLESAIAKLRPNTDAAAESLKATREARRLMKETKRPAKAKKDPAKTR